MPPALQVVELEVVLASLGLQLGAAAAFLLVILIIHIVARLIQFRLPA